MQGSRGWLTVGEAAQRLGVKPATLYAYVSRGTLSRRRSPTGQSLYDPAEVERLARRGRPRRAAGASEWVIESRITYLGEDRPYYRGRDALALAETQPFEAVAEWLWTADPRALLQVIVPALAATDALRNNLEPDAVLDVGRALIAGMVACLPGADVDGAMADRLWTKLTGAKPRPGLVDALRTAMVLLADHELPASTLAARIAASVRADPYATVIAGLGTSSGALHGGASLGAEIMLAEVADPGRAREAIGLRLRRGERVPGFGHLVYRSADARAGMLLERVRGAGHRADRIAVADALLAEARRRRLPPPNVDFALAALTNVAGMPLGSGEAIFGIARTAGWLAHAREEYERRTPLRLRSVYIGPE
jgi:citrate synthase